MHPIKLAIYSTLAMAAFAANSLLCRLALKDTSIDAVSFTAVRISSGALMLWLVMQLRDTPKGGHGTWRSAIALLIYAGTFSFAYISLSAGAGALLLFGAVQTTMILAGIASGERLNKIQTTGFMAAQAGLVMLVLPHIKMPSLHGSLLMLASGIAWGMYSMYGRNVTNPATVTAGNFLKAAPLAIAFSLFFLPWLRLDMHGLLYAVLSGAFTSGLGYVLWYRVIGFMSAITASTVQLISPLFAALGGTMFLNEAITPDMAISVLLILGGFALVTKRKNGRPITLKTDGNAQNN